ncbi:MAG: hypothetical protein ACYCQJ_13610 [Nitrososphaerales archaeon]
MLTQYNIDFIVNAITDTLPSTSDPLLAYEGTLVLVRSNGIIYEFLAGPPALWDPLQVPSCYIAYARNTGAIVKINRNLLLPRDPFDCKDCQRSCPAVGRPPKLFVDFNNNLYQYNVCKKGWDLLLNPQTGVALTLPYTATAGGTFSLQLLGANQSLFGNIDQASQANTLLPISIINGYANFDLTSTAPGLYAFLYTANYVNYSWTISALITVLPNDS